MTQDTAHSMSFMFTLVFLAPQVPWGTCETACMHAAHVFIYQGIPSLENPYLPKVAPGTHAQSFPRMETLSLLGSKKINFPTFLKGDSISVIYGSSYSISDLWFRQGCPCLLLRTCAEIQESHRECSPFQVACYIVYI